MVESGGFPARRHRPRSWRWAMTAITVLVVACVPSGGEPRPLISGSPVVGATLSVSNGAWINDPTTFAYTWESCTAPNAGCTKVGNDSNVYVVAESDVGRHIRVTVAGSNDAGTGWSASDSVGPVTGGVTPGVDCAVRQPGADLHGCDLSEEDLTEVDLSGANLDGATLAGTILSGANLTSVSAVEANFYEADLSGAALGDATLTGATFDYADLSTADLTGASAAGAGFYRATAIGAVLSGVDLTDADLTEADLTDADLTGAVFSNTTCPDGVAVSAPAVCE